MAPATLHFHSPCFDGIASAVLALDYLEGPGQWGEVELHPADNETRDRWLEDQLGDRAAVVDFPYHPRAAFWVDHHQTAFLAPDLEGDFRRRAGPWLTWDPKADSCAGVLWRHLQAALGHRSAQYSELVQWAEKIDGARYESVDEAMEARDPALVIAASLGHEAGPDYVVSLVKALRGAKLAAVAARPEVRRRFAVVRELQRAGLARLQRAAELQRQIVVFDVDTKGVELNRYSPYRIYPEADYSIGIIRSDEGVKITAMRNPWREFTSVPLGRIFRRHGGGGHQRVASLYLDAAQGDRADALLKAILSDVRSAQEEGDHA